jgi:hypothetical protein
MTASFQNEDDDLLIDRSIESDEDNFVLDTDKDDQDFTEITLEDVVELEEEESIGHKLQTYDPSDDGTDNYFDERYFDE